MHIRHLALVPLCALVIQAGCMAAPRPSSQNSVAAQKQPAPPSTPIPSRTRPAVNFNSANPIPPQPGR